MELHFAWDIAPPFALSPRSRDSRADLPRNSGFLLPLLPQPTSIAVLLRQVSPFLRSTSTEADSASGLGFRRPANPHGFRRSSSNRVPGTSHSGARVSLLTPLPSLTPSPSRSPSTNASNRRRRSSSSFRHSLAPWPHPLKLSPGKLTLHLSSKGLRQTSTLRHPTSPSSLLLTLLRSLHPVASPILSSTSAVLKIIIHTTSLLPTAKLPSGLLRHRTLTALLLPTPTLRLLSTNKPILPPALLLRTRTRLVDLPPALTLPPPLFQISTFPSLLPPSVLPILCLNSLLSVFLPPFLPLSSPSSRSTTRRKLLRRLQHLR